MAGDNERLIDRDPDLNDETTTDDGIAFYKSHTFKLVLKISLVLGLVSALITGLIITNARLSTVETLFTDTLAKVTLITEQQAIIVKNVKTLTTQQQNLVKEVATLDLTSAQGELSQALTILDTQSKAIEKQLAVTRNGLVSLSRMIKGSRVWQEDYSGQYQTLFDENKAIEKMINQLLDIKETKKEEPEYLEMDF